MATTDQINDLIANYTDLKAFYEGERSALEQARANLPSQIMRVIYVDEVNGLPGGDGTLEAPYPTIDAAIESYKLGQHARIWLLSDVTWSKAHGGVGGQFDIRGFAADGVTAQTRTITLADEAPNDTALAAGLTMTFGALRFANTTLVLGGGSKTWHFKSEGNLNLAFRNSTLDGSAGGSEALFTPAAGRGSIGVANVTTISMGGRWVDGFAAGVTLDTASTGLLIDPYISNA